MNISNICFIGDSHTGKSHLIHTYVYGYKPPYVSQMTIGMEFHKKIIENNLLYIWDYSLSNVLDKYLIDYLKKINLFFIVIDCENWESIQNIHKYINLIGDKSYYIIANKFDKIDNILYKNRLLDYLDSNFNNKYAFTTSYNKDGLDETLNNILKLVSLI